MSESLWTEQPAPKSSAKTVQQANKPAPVPEMTFHQAVATPLSPSSSSRHFAEVVNHLMMKHKEYWDWRIYMQEQMQQVREAVTALETRMLTAFATYDASINQIIESINEALGDESTVPLDASEIDDATFEDVLRADLAEISASEEDSLDGENPFGQGSEL